MPCDSLCDKKFSILILSNCLRISWMCSPCSARGAMEHVRHSNYNCSSFWNNWLSSDTLFFPRFVSPFMIRSIQYFISDNIFHVTLATLPVIISIHIITTSPSNRIMTNSWKKRAKTKSSCLFSRPLPEDECRTFYIDSYRRTKLHLPSTVDSHGTDFGCI